MGAQHQPGAVLTIDLGAIVANWRALRDRVTPAECAAVVKADAYGLGVTRVAPALARAGCRTFFVATVDEGIALRGCLAAAGNTDRAKPVIYVLNGIAGEAERSLASSELCPVLNSLDDVRVWAAFVEGWQRPPGAALHIDTGMSRLGLPDDELDALAADPSLLQNIGPLMIMSHLACAEDQGHPLNNLQRQRFAAAVERLPAAPTSFANSSGIFLGRTYHGNMVRPGAALYGVAPVAGAANPMRQVVRLQGRILQVREIDRGWSVGYGATHQADRRAVIATVAVGYADGFFRSLSNRGRARVAGLSAPMVGRVSMDLITIDVTGADGASVRPGQMVDLLDSHLTVDAVAADAGTIGYEVLTALGSRYQRVYVGGG